MQFTATQAHFRCRPEDPRPITQAFIEARPPIKPSADASDFNGGDNGSLYQVRAVS
jgi:hypothetical protein